MNKKYDFATEKETAPYFGPFLNGNWYYYFGKNNRHGIDTILLMK
ncbi:MAG: hypothetical protein AAFX53_00695 [Bacteroidota bacterium]